MVVIKNFLGHASLQTTQIYAELSQSTIDKNLKEEAARSLAYYITAYREAGLLSRKINGNNIIGI